MSSNGSSHGSEETTTGSGKKKQKKKKRSVLANQSNPHHVDNCTLSLVALCSLASSEGSGWW